MATALQNIMTANAFYFVLFYFFRIIILLGIRHRKSQSSPLLASALVLFQHQGALITQHQTKLLGEELLPAHIL